MTHPLFQRIAVNHFPGLGDYECFPNTGHPLDPRNDYEPCDCGECDECDGQCDCGSCDDCQDEINSWE